MLSPALPILYRKTPPFEWPESLSLRPHQTVKVAAAALACFALFSIQLGFSFAIGAKISLACAAITRLSQNLREDTSDWFRVKNIDREALFSEIRWRLLFVPICVGILYTAIGLPVQAAMQQILFGDIKMIILATLVAPIAEEILFRGVIQERAEDMAYLINRHLYPISPNQQKVIGCLAQGALFGAVHVIGDQIKASRFIKAGLFFNLAWVGSYFGYLKNRDDSLISPMAIHTTQNSAVALGLLAFKNWILGS